MLTRPLARHLITLLLAANAGWANADTDISQTPLITNEVQDKPNIMFVLDNSGSMRWDYTPDALAPFNNASQCEASSDFRMYGCRSSQCNSSAYNPNTTYDPPVTPDGRNYPNMPISAAWSDGFRPAFSSNTVNYDGAIDTRLPDGSVTVTVTLSSNLAVGTRVAFLSRSNPALWLSGTVTNAANKVNTFVLTFSSMHDGSKSDWRLGILSTQNLSSSYYFNYTGSQPRLNWTYNSEGNLTSNTFSQECRTNAQANNNQSNTTFTRVNVSGLETEAQQNYANWYSYYRTRILAMRSAAGRAVEAMDSNYRVGFGTLNDASGNFNGGVSNELGEFANIADFDSAQRVLFYSNLYSANATGSTPLRRALAKAGRYYGNELSGQTDPVPAATLSCQRNYTVLTTDGYWNDTSDPQRLDGNAIGNWDSSANRPVFDGGVINTTVTRTYAFTSSVKISNFGCGFFGFSPTYRHTLEETVTTVTGSTTTTTTNTGPWDTCSSTPPATPASTTQTVTAESTNTLADVARYYHLAPLARDAVGPVSGAGVPTLPLMTTFTLGFGVSGTLRYDPNYESQTSGDFADLKSGAKNWPKPTSGKATTIDDLWHAAVNGGGVYYAASDPGDLAESLKSAFDEINRQSGAGASAASSSLRPVLGTDQIFVGSYRTVDWDGSLKAFTLEEDKTTFSDNPDWDAATLLASVSATSRAIYYMGRSVDAGGTESRALTSFTYDNLSADADAATLTAHFNNLCGKPSIPTQCADLDTDERETASGANLVNFIRGDQSLEGTLYRDRESVLGPIVDASPVFVGKPPFTYTDDGYNSFKANQNSRCPVVYAAANDGMLHAFSAKTGTGSTCQAGGTELWAYVPRAIMGELYRLADTEYRSKHRFFVNGTPVVGDISLSAEASGTDEPEWSTILVGGFGAGGRGYYALDITNPSSPSSLWEFSDADMGLSYGNPVITKVPDAEGTPTWVVAFTSGLNNSGNGYLYILNAHSGQVMYKIPTLVDGAAVGSSGSPSGLNKLNAWIERPSDNTAARFYAGDMLGNLWRFNAGTAEDLAAPGPSSTDTRSFRVARFVANGQGQPITVRPELAKIEGQAVVLVGTGRYLGLSDAADLSSTQSVYGIKDPLSSTTGWGDVRANAGALVQQTLTEVQANATTGAPASRTISANTVDWGQSGVAGWYLDLPSAGERVFVPMSLAFDTLTLATLVPSPSACSGSGYSWLFDLNIRTGSYVSERAGDQVAATKSDKAVMGISTLQVDGETKTRQVITNSDGTVTLRDHVTAPSSAGGLRRTSWREIVPTPQ